MYIPWDFTQILKSQNRNLMKWAVWPGPNKSLFYHAPFPSNILQSLMADSPISLALTLPFFQEFELHHSLSLTPVSACVFLYPLYLYNFNQSEGHFLVFSENYLSFSWNKSIWPPIEHITFSVVSFTLLLPRLKFLASVS